MGTRTCPRCRVVSEISATSCDCGYVFSTGRMAPAQTRPRAGGHDALGLAEEYRSLVKLVLLQAAVGGGTRIAAFGARRLHSDGLLLAVNLVGLILLISLSVMAAVRAFRTASAMGLASPRGWAAAIGVGGIFGMLVMNREARKWSERQGIQFSLLGPDLNDARRVDRDRGPLDPRERVVAGTKSEPEYGALWRRLLAMFLDVLTALAMGTVFAIASGFLTDPIGVTDQLVPILEGFWAGVLGVLIYAAFEGSRLGGTPGKWLMGLAVETDGHEPASLLRAIWRNTAKYLSGAAFPVSLLMAGLTARKQAPHDYLARTVVVRRRRQPGEVKNCATAFVFAGLVFASFVVVWQHEGRPSIDLARVRAEFRSQYPVRLEALPDVDAEALFDQTHRRCFDEHYKRRWDGNTSEVDQYRRCMAAAYAQRFADAVALESVEFAPHVVDGEPDPVWTKVAIRGRVAEGRVGEFLVLLKERRCEGDGDGHSGSDAPLYSQSLTLKGGGEFEYSTLSGIFTKSCRLSLGLYLEGVPYGKGITVDLPLADPVLVAEKNARHAVYVAAIDQARVCRAGEGPKLQSIESGEMTPDVRAIVDSLRSRDRSRIEEALKAAIALGATTRQAIPALTPLLEDRGFTGQSAARALGALDPEGTVVTPVLLCQLGEPDRAWKYAAAGVLLRIGNRAGQEALAEGLKREPTSQRYAVMRELETSGRKAAALLPPVIECAVSEPDLRLRSACISLLPRIDPADRASLRALEKAQADEDLTVREKAKSAWQYASELRLRELVKTPESLALGMVTDPSSAVRLQCLHTATSTRPYGTAVAAALRQAANDPDEKVREAARRVLADPS